MSIKLLVLGGNGLWATPANWQGDFRLKSDGDVVIDTPAIYTVTYSVAHADVDGLIVGDDDFVQQGGTPFVVSTALFAEDLTQTGGVLALVGGGIVKGEFPQGGLIKPDAMLNLTRAAQLVTFRLDESDGPSPAGDTGATTLSQRANVGGLRPMINRGGITDYAIADGEANDETATHIVSPAAPIDFLGDENVSAATSTADAAAAAAAAQIGGLAPSNKGVVSKTAGGGITTGSNTVCVLSSLADQTVLSGLPMDRSPTQDVRRLTIPSDAGDPITITAPSTATIAFGQTTSIPGISISDTSSSSDELVSVDLYDETGLLSASDAPYVSHYDGGTFLIINGTVSQDNATLSTFADTEASTSSDLIQINVSDEFDNLALAEITITATGLLISAPATEDLSVGSAAKLSGFDISDAGTPPGQTFTVGISDAVGIFSATGTGVSGSGTSALTVVGSLTAVNADLETLTDTASKVGTDVINISASDGSGGTASTQAVAVTINGPPVVEAPTTSTVILYEATPIHGISIAEDGETADEIFYVDLIATGRLSASGSASIGGNGSGELILSGSLPDVESTLTTLTDTEDTAVSDVISVYARDSFGGSSQAEIAVTATGLLLVAPGPVDLTQGQAAPLTGVAVMESGAQPAETFTVTVSDGSGLLSATGSGISGAGTTTLSVSGSETDVDAALATLTDTPVALGSDVIQITAVDSLGNEAAPTTVEVTTEGPLVITAPAGETVVLGDPSPIKGLSLAQAGDSASEVFYVGVSDSTGALSGGDTGVISVLQPNLLFIDGSLDEVNAALSTITDIETGTSSDTIFLSVSDNFNSADVQAQVPVTALGLLITAPGVVTVLQGEQTSVSGLVISESEATSDETFSVTLSDTAGVLTATGAGVSEADSSSLVIAGSLSQVNADLSTLTDTDAVAGSEAITVTATDSLGNTAAPATIQVTIESRLPLASPVVSVAGISAPTSINLGDVRAGPNAYITVVNAAEPPAESLDVAVDSTGAAEAFGFIEQLAPGQSDGTSLTLGFSDYYPGPANGTVTLDFTSDGSGTDGFPPVTLPSQSFVVTGTTYVESQPYLSAPATLIFHAGDSGEATFSIKNASGYVENLAATIIGATDGISAPLGALPEIAAGDTAAVPLTISTAATGTIDGVITVSCSSDGDGTDGAPTTLVGPFPLVVTATIDNYATLGLSATAGELTFNGTDYLLDLGTVMQGDDPLSGDLLISNTASGPADLLSGNIVASDEDFTNTPLEAYSDLTAGVSEDVGTLSLPTADVGTFTETLSLHSLGTNASGYSGALATAIVIVTGTIEPSQPQLYLTGITPDHGSDLGSVTLTIDGANLKADEQVAVVAPDGTAHDATQVRWASSGTLWATFDLTEVPVGTYNVQVSDGSRSATLPGAFTVDDGPAGKLSVNLVVPQYIDQGATAAATVTYTNIGETDVATPLLEVDSTQALLQQTGDAETGSSSLEFLAIGSGGPVGVLAPGASGTFSFGVDPTDPTPTGNVSVNLGVAGSTSVIATTGTTGTSLPPVSSTIDWASLESSLQPPTVDATDWKNVYTQFVAQVGTTTASLDAALSADATALAQAGQPTSDVATLLQYQLFQASGALAGAAVDATDLGGSSSSLSLSLGRSYGGTLLDRDLTGAFGDGWSFTYDVTAVTSASGDVYVQSPTDLHVFTKQPDGTYAAQSGDPSTLAVSGGLYSVNDGSGDIERFDASGRLASYTDSDGNVTDLTYGGNGVLQMVRSLTTGETITFASNAAGRIVSATDSDGQTVAYTYDPTNTKLLSATTAAGTTTYAYAPATGSATDNALASIIGPGGVQQTFAYDAAGRLASQSDNGGTGAETYSYASPGAVTVTDGSGDETTLLYGSNEAVAQAQDGLGNVTQLQSNAAGELTGTTTPGGSTYQYAYDASGNLTGYTDPLGSNVSATYAPGTTDLTDFTDQRGEQTHYTYDAAGDVTGITYVDGGGDTYSYSTQGMLKSSTDADGKTTSYRYDGAGDLTSKAFSDGTADTYTYDTHGDLTSATVSGQGTTSYVYDAADRLTSVTNPQGQTISYTYDAAGELASRTLPDGSVTRDSYDASGRLTELQDGSGNLIDRYTYSTAGQLIRTDTGGGAYTTYQYDANGSTTEILDSNADGSVADRMDYTYNADGQVIEEATSDGLWTYGYDASDQLTSAVFQSVNPAIQSESLSYVYDAAGNRVSQTVNGVTTAYTTNALDQYTQAGGTTYAYDADGNMISQTDSSGTTRFTYNEAGQLASESGSGATYQYTYDALGNLISTMQNGTVSDYVNDPLSLSVSGQTLTSAAQVENPSGTDQQTYDYGLGLAATTGATGTSYYDSDLIGNVVGLSGSNGRQQQAYIYAPYGHLIYSTSSAPGNFLSSGQFGEVSTDGNITSDRARSYDQAIGRFITRDPIQLDGGTNPYAFADNDPVSNLDPFGTNLLKAYGGVLNVVSGALTLQKAYQVGATAYEVGEAAIVLAGAPELAVAAAIGLSALAVYKILDGALNIQDGAQDLTEIGGFSDAASVIVSAIGLSKIPAVENVFKSFAARFVGPNDPFLPLLQSEAKTVSSKLLKLLVRGLSDVASLFFDPHLITFDGFYYSFQTAGEFVLTRQMSGGNFEVQARISAPVGASSYSIITELGIQVGPDRVTIDSTRTSAVCVNGVAAVFTGGEDVLAGGMIMQTSSGYVVTLSTGETVTADILSYGTQSGPSTTSYGINTSIALNPFVEKAGTIQGLLGNLNGDPAKDLTLADGTVLPTNLPTSELYGAFADSWRVTQATSLLDYGPGQTTATFTDKSYPGMPISAASFPEAAIQMATAVVEQMGITDPGLQQDAIYDYLVTGDRALLVSEANLQQQGVTTSMSADLTLPAAPPEAGIIAVQVSEIEAAAGSTTVQFMVYRSGDTSAAGTVSYAVVAPDGTYVGAASFGGVLPSGTISFAAGQTSADLPITLTSGIGDAASKTLQVQLSAAAPVDVIGQVAQVQIVNPAPVAGPAPAFNVELVGDPGLTPTQSGDTWTFDLGTLSQALAVTSLPITLAVMNTAGAAADLLSGTVTASGSASFTSTVSPSFQDLMGGAIQDVASFGLDPNTFAGGTETLTTALQDTNASGYVADLPTQTVTIQIEPDVPCFAAGTLIETDRGKVPVEALREGDLVVAVESGEHRLRPVRWVGRRRVNLLRHPRPELARPIRIRRNAFEDGAPRRDLLVSPEHCIFVRGVLVPARLLLNGGSIAQEEGFASVEYLHLKLDRHAVLLAEGLTAESYLDTGNRGTFDGQSPLTLHPEFAVDPAHESWTTDACAPLAVDPATVEPIWRGLRDRSEAVGLKTAMVETIADPLLRLEADGRLLRPVHVADGRHLFLLGRPASVLRLVSRAARPTDARPWLDDRRLLGVCIRRIDVPDRCGSRRVAMDQLAQVHGWHDVEGSSALAFRWTDGAADIPGGADVGVVEIQLAGEMQYPAAA